MSAAPHSTISRRGWRKIDGQWQTVNEPDDTPLATRVTVDVGAVDTSLTASHERMTRALAIETRRLEAAAETGNLTGADIETLARLSTTWRTLVQHEPTPDYSDMTDEQLRASLASVKARGDK